MIEKHVAADWGVPLVYIIRSQSDQADKDTM